MAEDGVAALERSLGAPPPDGVVAALSPDELRHLARIVERARRSQREALRKSAEEGMRQIPFPLRVAIKKVLG